MRDNHREEVIQPLSPAMTDPQTLALISRLERAQRRWKRLALSALAALLFVLALGGVTVVFQQQQIRTERERAEQMLYYSHVALAERLASQRQKP